MSVLVDEDLLHVEVAWSGVPGATGYEVYVSTDASWAQPIGAADLQALAPAASVTTPHTELTPGNPDAVVRYTVVAIVGGKRTDPTRPVGAGLPRAAALGTPSLHLAGRDAGHELGASLTHADLDGDGREDLVLGYPSPFAASSDQIAISRNRLFGLSTDWQAVNGAGYEGWALAAADVDGDGFPDAFSGAPPTDDWTPGFQLEATVVHGSPDDLYPPTVLDVAPSRPSTGWSVAGLADVDGDGREEVAFAAPVLPLDETVSTSGAAAGEIEVLELGSAGLVQAAPAVHGAAGDRFGESIASVPGLLGAGSVCLAAGEPGAPGGGSVQTFRLDAAGLVPVTDLQPPAGAPPGFGRVVAASGDVLGQGPGLLVAAQPTSGGGAIAFLYQSPAQPPVWTLGSFQVNGGLKVHPSRWLAGAGDVNCDGFDDVLVGEPAAAGGAGRVSLYLGGSTTSPADPVWQVTGSPQERLGDQVMLHDFDGDGCSEVVVSAPDFALLPGTSSSTRGEVFVWRGSLRQGLRLDAGAVLRSIPDGNFPVNLSGPTFSDPLGSGPWTATIDWGAGDPPVVVGPGQCAASDATFFSCIAHAYLAVGTYRVKVRVDATDGRFVEAVTTAEISK